MLPQLRRYDLGEFNHLLQELHLVAGRFQWYCRLSVGKFINAIISYHNNQNRCSLLCYFAAIAVLHPWAFHIGRPLWQSLCRLTVTAQQRAMLLEKFYYFHFSVKTCQAFFAENAHDCRTISLNVLTKSFYIFPMALRLILSLSAWTWSFSSIPLDGSI